ncbi:hypothetical protein [Clostridium sp.]|uniref:hypothetical protein n=1 Tax=Clostridium sp. TaxID=1506 RepID=UPI002907C082|nr:hypothetical protein [Clostridium sp.]MDU4480372.1 hypothetical protein [Clostridium sp.]
MKCEGFICDYVNKCIRPDDKDCSEKCEYYCNCQACMYEYDAETDECYPKKSKEELMEDGKFYIDENGNAQFYEK